MFVPVFWLFLWFGKFSASVPTCHHPCQGSLVVSSGRQLWLVGEEGGQLAHGADGKAGDRRLL